MTLHRLFVPFLAFVLGSVFCSMQAQTTSSALSSLPHVIKYSGMLKESDSQTRSGSVGVIFAIYDKEDAVAPVWLETQSVTEDETGHYTVLLGSTKTDGLPAAIFASGEARWIGVQAEGQAEQPRTLLVSVPYALKAADADTLGGKPLSAFLMADSGSSAGTKSARLAESSAAVRESTGNLNTGTANTFPNFLTKFDSGTSIVNSGVFEDNSGNVGIGTSSPAARLDISAGAAGDIALGYNFQGVSQFLKGFANPHALGNVPSQLNVGLMDGAFTGLMVQDVKDGGAFNSASISFATHHGGVSAGTRMTIDKDGRVGVGTTTPGFPLEVVGTVKANTLSDGFISFGAAQINRNGGAVEFQFPGGAGNDVRFFSNAASPVSFLAGSGNVGIGIASPTFKLQVQGTAKANSFTDGFINLGLAQINRTGGAVELQLPGGAGNDVKMFSGTATPITFMAATGNVGIGTSSPSATLDVNGNIHTTGTLFFNDGSPQFTAGITQVIPNMGLTTSVIANKQSVGLLNSCLANQILKWSGTAWACSADQTGAGGIAYPYSSGNQNTPSGAFVVTQTNSVVLANEPTFQFATTSIPGAVIGFSSSTTGAATGVGGFSNSPDAPAMIGWNGSTTPSASGNGSQGVIAQTDNTAGTALEATARATSGNTIGIKAHIKSPNGIAISAQDNSGTGMAALFTGKVEVSSGTLQVDTAISGAGFALPVTGGLNVQNGGATITGSTSIQGNLIVSGNISGGSLTKPGGTFKIDHPLDPAGKYLYHSFVESPDMMNIYNGMTSLDSKGEAWITMPDWFEALNMDFRYQLTAMGRPAPNLFIAREISGNRFKISGGRANGRVSWQVTGIRHDAWADAHRFKVEEVKSPAEQGTYLSPELFTKSGSDKIATSDQPKN